MPCTFRALLLLLVLSPDPGLYAQLPDSSLTPGRIALGFGFLGRTGDIGSIWSNGFSFDAFIGYNPWNRLGFELGGVYAGTGITGWMKNSVRTVEKNSGATGTSETTGGDFLQLYLGPGYSFVLMPGFVGNVNAGGSYYGSREGGMNNIEGYEPRWTYGWGYYAAVHLSGTGTDGGLFYGVTVRYTALYAKVNDFYYDRVFGATGYDMIPATYLWDRRVEFSLHLGFAFW